MAAGTVPTAYPKRGAGLIGVHGAAPDERPVHVNVVENRGAEEVRARVCALVEDDNDPADDVCGHNWRERRQEPSGVPAESEPVDVDIRYDGLWRVTAEEVHVSVGGHHIETGCPRTTMRSDWGGNVETALPDVIPEFGKRDALNVDKLGGRRGKIVGRTGLD